MAQSLSWSTNGGIVPVHVTVTVWPGGEGTVMLSVGGVEAAAQGGTLPFTGLSLLATVLVGLALIATGIVLRRREGTKS